MMHHFKGFFLNILNVIALKHAFMRNTGDPLIVRVQLKLEKIMKKVLLQQQQWHLQRQWRLQAICQCLVLLN